MSTLITVIVDSMINVAPIICVWGSLSCSAVLSHVSVLSSFFNDLTVPSLLNNVIRAKTPCTGSRIDGP